VTIRLIDRFQVCQEKYLYIFYLFLESNLKLTTGLKVFIVTRVNSYSELCTTTQRDLAKVLKLDRSSVSLALRGSTKVSEKTRSRVLQAARRMNYRPNLAAQQMKSSQPLILGLLLPETFKTLSEPIVVMTLQALAQRSAEKGIMLNILTESMVKEMAGNPNFMLPGGMFVWGDVNANIIEADIFKNIPLQILDPCHVSYEANSLPAVQIDNSGGAQAVTRHLIYRGAARLLFIMGEPEHLGHKKRLEGAKKAWMHQSPAGEMIVSRFDDLTVEQLNDFISEPGGAIFCSNDTTAILIWQKLMTRGISIPEQVLLAGFDNTPAAQLIGLTSAVFDCNAFARTALEALLQSINKNCRIIQSNPIPVILHPGKTT